jgi:hypothetical protein
VVTSVIEPSKVVVPDHVADRKSRRHAESAEDQRAGEERDC